MAPQVAALIDQGLAAGWLSVSAGRVGAIGRDDCRFVVAWTPRDKAPCSEIFDAVINCTGPDSNIAGSGNPLFVSLLKNGIAAADPFGLGLAVDAEACALSADGTADPLVRIAGPLARGRFGEVMGLPEVSVHAKLVAGLLVGALEQMQEVES
jgi:uncharacterized NAD(P)/FAD-binding protein YdhS